MKLPPDKRSSYQRAQGLLSKNWRGAAKMEHP
jgi:hypothetical protein